MKCKIQLGILVSLLNAAVVLADEKFLAELPPYLTPCKQTDPNFQLCYAKNFQAVFSEWKDGVPGLKSVGSIDPWHIKRVSVLQDNNNPVAQINVDMTDMVAVGISKMKVVEASYDPEKKITRLRYAAPKLVINSHYAIKGHILNLALNGNGHAGMEADDSELSIAIRHKRRDEHGHIFQDVDKLRLEFTKIGGFHIQLDNLFNGQKELEDSTNAVFNQNWRDLYDALRPAISSGIQSGMINRFKKIFAYVPATYFIEDVPDKS